MLRILKDRVVLCDIDGTLAILGDRDYRNLDDVFEDDINRTVLRIIKSFADSHAIIFVTGRRESARSETVRWLDYHDVPYDALVMKPDDEEIKNVPFKKRLYDYIKNSHPEVSIDLALDDYPKVLDMWRGLGLVTLEVPSVH